MDRSSYGKWRIYKVKRPSLLPWRVVAPDGFVELKAADFQTVLDFYKEN